MKKYVSLASFGLASALFLSLAGCNKSADTTGKGSGSATSSSANTSIAKSSPAGASKTTSSPTEASWVGTWKPETEGTKIQSLTIKANGSYNISYKDSSEDNPLREGTWSASGDQIELRAGESGSNRRMTGTLESEGRLAFREVGQKTVFVKS
jgi:hypothetical protein